MLIEEIPLYNYEPTLYILFFGLVLSLIPSLWMLKDKPNIFKFLNSLTLLALFLTFDLTIFGSFTRLTDSGLGCPDWPGCYGKASPIGADFHIAKAEELMPDGPVTLTKAWIEMIHRYLATTVGGLILFISILSWFIYYKYKDKQDLIVNPWFSIFILFWVILQGLFGAWTVTMKLFPFIVTLHLLGGFTLIVLLEIQFIKQQILNKQLLITQVKPKLKYLLWISLILTIIQSFLGGWVSSNYAVLACDSFPYCNGSLWPEMTFKEGFEFWRPLGLSSNGDYIDFQALVTIHYIHRIFAYLLTFFIIYLYFYIYNNNTLKTQKNIILYVFIIQFLTGVINIIFNWPIISALIHTGGAAILISVLVWILVITKNDSKS